MAPQEAAPREGLSDLPPLKASLLRRSTHPSLWGQGEEDLTVNTHRRKPLRHEREENILYPNKQPEEDAEGSESHQTKPQIKITRDWGWESGSVSKMSSRKLPLGQPCHLRLPPAPAGPPAAPQWALGECRVIGDRQSGREAEGVGVGARQTLVQDHQCVGGP